MARRKDYQLAATRTFAVEEDTYELLLKSMGVATSSGILAKEKLIAIDPTTKALLVKWIDAPPSGSQGDTGAQGAAGVGDTGSQGLQGDTGAGNGNGAGVDLQAQCLAYLGI